MFDRLKKRTRRVQARVRSARKLKRLSVSDGPGSAMLARAIEETLRNELGLGEQQWIERIESVRAQLRNDDTRISVTDYGTGGAATGRSDGTMYQGVVQNWPVSQVCNASMPPRYALLLFKLVRMFQPGRMLELGTCLGISAAYQAAAGKLNGDGRLVTMEGAPALASISRSNLEKLDLDNASVVSGRFQDNLERALADLGGVDYVFIDGHHDEIATIDYFETIVPHCTEESVVVLDDISWSEGMRRAWTTISSRSGVGTAVDLGKIGICVLRRNSTAETVFPAADMLETA